MLSCFQFLFQAVCFKKRSRKQLIAIYMNNFSFFFIRVFCRDKFLFCFLQIFRRDIRSEKKNEICLLIKAVKSSWQMKLFSSCVQPTSQLSIECFVHAAANFVYFAISAEIEQFRHTFCQQRNWKILRNFGENTLKLSYTTLCVLYKMKLILFFATMTQTPANKMRH